MGAAAASRPCVDGEAAVPPDRWIVDGGAAVPPVSGAECRGGAAASRPCVDGEAAVPPPAAPSGKRSGERPRTPFPGLAWKRPM